MVINCLIVDDEQPAREVLLNYIDKLPSLRLVRACSDAVSALQVLQFEPIDLMFLDIQMPGLNGVQLLKNLSRPPKVIFTTAFSEYAVEGFDLGATDFLLKPFSFERFIKAVSRVMNFENMNEGTGLTSFGKSKSDGQLSEIYKTHLFLKADKVTHRVDTKDLLFLSAFGNYTKVYSLSKMLIVHESLAGFESMLNPEQFMRVHKSYLIAIHKITKLDGNRLFIEHHEIPIGEAFRRELQSKLK